MCFLWFRITEKYQSVEFSAKRRHPSAEQRPLILQACLRDTLLTTCPPREKKTNPTRQSITCCSKRDSIGKWVGRETRFHCPDCDVGFCAAPCFRSYHTRSNFD
ncbi:hypothetical protein TNCV_3117751 [Trichonephila clavipes]|uniref:PiggyBac transposable element-derived protein 4 C-terminal zinc-ribbon domain-containing protein n=1 Tax=Trichonephila clavipes TaxID=2585209 RepID=A0A8X6W974_TRICX|nr:hypothetical protein TNCV_3117751 [Trichonephila clavipes]